MYRLLTVPIPLIKPNSVRSRGDHFIYSLWVCFVELHIDFGGLNLLVLYALLLLLFFTISASTPSSGSFFDEEHQLITEI